MADCLTVERKKMAATTVWVPAASSRSEQKLVHQQYVRRKPDRFVASRTLLTGRSDDQLQVFLPSYFRCLLLCTLCTSPACWPWPGIFFNQFTLLGKSDPPGQQGAGVSSSPSPRLSHFAALGAAFCCRRGSFVAMVREGWHQLRFTGCRGADSKWLMTFWTANNWRWLTADLYIYFFKLTQRFLFEVGTLQTVFGCCPGFENQKGNQPLNKPIILYSDPKRQNKF